MQRTFSHMLLITWIILFSVCQKPVVTKRINAKGIIVSDTFNKIDSQLVDVCLLHKNVQRKEMLKVVAAASNELKKIKTGKNEMIKQARPGGLVAVVINCVFERTGNNTQSFFAANLF